MKAFLIKKEIIATETLALQFEAENPIEFQAGQYGIFELIAPPFTEEGKPNKRVLSFASSPKESPLFTIATRKSPSAYKRSLAILEKGQAIELGRIGGNFLLPTNTDRPLVLIAGGMGITPFISMLKTIIDIKRPYQIKLFYSNHSRKTAAFYDELVLYENSLPNFQYIPVLNERFSSSILKKYVPDILTPTYMLVGPPPMMDTVLPLLITEGIPQSDIITEKFSG